MPDPTAQSRIAPATWTHIAVLRGHEQRHVSMSRQEPFVIFITITEHVFVDFNRTLMVFLGLPPLYKFSSHTTEPAGSQTSLYGQSK